MVENNSDRDAHELQQLMFGLEYDKRGTYGVNQLYTDIHSNRKT
jgi:hypothetical protein